MPLFVVLAEGEQLDDDLVRAIARRVREDCSPRHVPSEVLAVSEIPRTLSGKVLEVPVKRILMGEDPARAASRDSLANPAALDWFVELASARAAGAKIPVCGRQAARGLSGWQRRAVLRDSSRTN